MNYIETPQEYMDRLSLGINVRTKKDKVKKDFVPTGKYNFYYTIDEKGRKKGRESFYDPAANSWRMKPLWDYDDDWDYSKVVDWYYHKGHRSWGYGDEYPGWHPLPANSPRRVKKEVPATIWDWIIGFGILLFFLAALFGG